MLYETPMYTYSTACGRIELWVSAVCFIESCKKTHVRYSLRLVCWCFPRNVSIMCLGHSIATWYARTVVPPITWTIVEDVTAYTLLYCEPGYPILSRPVRMYRQRNRRSLLLEIPYFYTCTQTRRLAVSCLCAYVSMDCPLYALSATVGY